MLWNAVCILIDVCDAVVLLDRKREGTLVKDRWRAYEAC